jgi:hypothetical protein
MGTNTEDGLEITRTASDYKENVEALTNSDAADTSEARRGEEMTTEEQDRARRREHMRRW